MNSPEIDLKNILDQAAKEAVETSGGPYSYQGSAEAIVLAERVSGPWKPDFGTPDALVEAVAEARKRPALTARIQREKSHLREQVRTAKARIDGENETNGTSLSYPTWVSSYLEDNEID